MDLSLEMIIEAGLNELLAWDVGAAPPRTVEERYALVVLRFLRAETEDLARLAATSLAEAATEDTEFLATATDLRLAFRRRAFDTELLQRASLLAARPSRWQGELCMLIASFLSVNDDYAAARTWYDRAASSLERQGCVKKALRAKMNRLVCDSHIDPDRNLVAAYHDLYRASLRHDRRDLTVTTTCLLNMSREFQRSGALLAALKYCEKGLEVAEFQFGSLTHHLLLAQRAHLLCGLGRTQEAKIDADVLRISAFVEVQGALAVIDALLAGRPAPTVPNAAELPTWRERRDEISRGETGTRHAFSLLESRLIEFLGKGPRDRIDVLEHLYGSALDYETKLNRFKSLLSTLRRKAPEAIRYEDGRYLLGERILLPLKKHRKIN